MDETGTRHPDKKSNETGRASDCFGLGGLLIRKEDEAEAGQLYQDIVQKWNIQTPFHLTDMRSRRKGFSWLGRRSQHEQDAFWSDYHAFLRSIPALATGCIISRPGYLARGYLELHPDTKWLLCRSAFDITVERATKYAILNVCKLDIVFEGSIPTNDIMMKGYFSNLKDNGLEFDPANSEKYKPLDASAFRETLGTIQWKTKESRMLQIADSYIYSIARQTYDRNFPMYCHLRDARRIINFALGDVDRIKAMGIKYYCY